MYISPIFYINSNKQIWTIVIIYVSEHKLTIYCTSKLMAQGINTSHKIQFNRKYTVIFYNI